MVFNRLPYPRVFALLNECPAIAAKESLLLKSLLIPNEIRTRPVEKNSRGVRPCKPSPTNERYQAALLEQILALKVWLASNQRMETGTCASPSCRQEKIEKLVCTFETSRKYTKLAVNPRAQILACEMKCKEKNYAKHKQAVYLRYRKRMY